MHFRPSENLMILKETKFDTWLFAIFSSDDLQTVTSYYYYFTYINYVDTTVLTYFYKLPFLFYYKCLLVCCQKVHKTINSIIINIWIN